jgi:chemotaxis signal transduction protein
LSRALIPFKLQNVWVALEASIVREILGERSWVRVRPITSEIPGLLSWQGRAIALLDFGSLFEGMQPLKADEKRHRTLVAQAEEGTVAIPVDDVMEVVEVDESSVRPRLLTRLAYCSKEVELHGKPVPVLNLSELLKRVLSSPSS